MRQNKHFGLDIEQNFLRPGELSPCLRRGFRGGSEYVVYFLFNALNIEQEMHYIAIFNDILLALDANLSSIATRLL